MAKKVLTRDEAQSKKDKAFRFVRDALDDPDHADAIADEDLDDWIERKGVTIINQGERSLKMANGNGDPRSKAELLDTIDDLQQQVDDLEDVLSSIADLATPDEADDDSDDNSDDDSD